MIDEKRLERLYELACVARLSRPEGLELVAEVRRLRAENAAMRKPLVAMRGWLGAGSSHCPDCDPVHVGCGEYEHGGKCGVMKTIHEAEIALGFRT